MFKNYRRSILVTLIIVLLSSASLAAIFENATPDDPNTTIVRVSDPNDFFFQPFALLLTNDSGYRLDCQDITKLRDMFTGLGFPEDMISWMPNVSVDSPQVTNSNFQDNPALSCERGDEELFVVDYPNGEQKYFIDFLDGNNLNMVGCQGLIDAMGFDTAAATPLDYSLAQGRFFNIGDELDIHCMDGEPVGPASCGEHENGSSWTDSIANGEQQYTCNGGNAELTGTPSCFSGYQVSGSSCVEIPPQNCGSHQHGDSWNVSISNGQQTYTCNNGNSIRVSGPSCNSGYVASGYSCVIEYANCGQYQHGASWSVNVSNGTRTDSCNNGSVTTGSTTCINDFGWNGSACVYQPKNCNNGARLHGSSWVENIANGYRTDSCNDGTVSAGAINCDTQYTLSNDACVYVPKDCGSHKHNTSWNVDIGHGHRTDSCNDGVTATGTPACDTQYNWNGSACVYVPKNCGSRTHGSNWNIAISNGTRTYSCNDGVTNAGDINCNSHYGQSGSSCVYVNASCGSHAHGTTWLTSGLASGSWCEPQINEYTNKCNDGTSSVIDTSVKVRGIPKSSGRMCP